jgi:hypothetical protein
MIPCNKSENHTWFISNNKIDIRLVDVQCKECKTNLAIALKLFSGIADHG